MLSPPPVGRRHPLPIPLPTSPLYAFGVLASATPVKNLKTSLTYSVLTTYVKTSLILCIETYGFSPYS